MTAQFESARLAMRAQRIDDAEALHEGYRDDATMRWWSSAAHADLDQTRAYIAARVDQPGQRGWVMTLKGSDRAIGTLWAGERREGVSEIGYMLVPSAVGQGYATEGVTRLLDLLFVEEGLRRVFADTDPDNAPSNALLKRLGFTLEGRLRAEWETHIGVRDTLLWGLLADEWNKPPPEPPRKVPPPDLADPAQRAAYKAELRMVARPVRYLGLALAVGAAVLAGLRARYWPHLPVIVPLFLLGVAALHLFAGIVIRTKYHRARMRG